MNLLELLKQHPWWGKIIGSFFGFLMAGPVGAFFGLLVGNFFDRGLILHLSKPFSAYLSEKNKQVRAVFFESVFTTLGFFAKADGQVSSAAIQYSNDVMLQMHLNAKEIVAAQQYFRQGKSPQFSWSHTIGHLRSALNSNPALIHLFVETQYGLLKVIGMSDKKYTLMNELLLALQLAPLYFNIRFARDFPAWHQSTSAPGPERNRQYQSHTDPFTHRQHKALNDPYAILETESTASKAEIKRAYRRLMSRYHPDKLIAKGASSSTIQAATEKTQKIRKAYDQICAMKGW